MQMGNFWVKIFRGGLGSTMEMYCLATLTLYSIEKYRPMVKYAYLRASNARASFVKVPEFFLGKNAHQNFQNFQHFSKFLIFFLKIFKIFQKFSIFFKIYKNFQFFSKFTKFTKFKKFKNFQIFQKFQKLKKNRKILKI